MTNAEESAVVARGITQAGPWGPVYGPIDLDIPAGGLTVLRGPAGSGRTALQMTLAGRMKQKTGDLSVFGRTTAKKIFAVAGLAAIDELDAVYNAVRVVDLITEQIRWDAPWYRLIGKATVNDLERVCRPVFGDLPLPDLDEYVDDLTELDRMLLRIALADTQRPPLLVIGSIDQVTSDDNQKTLVQRLADLGRERTVVTSTVNPLPDELGQRLVIDVPNLTHDELTGQGER